MNTSRKTRDVVATATASRDSLKAVRQRDGSFSIGGTKESQLVSKSGGIAVKAAPTSRRQLSAKQIKNMAEHMKVAA